MKMLIEEKTHASVMRIDNLYNCVSDYKMGPTKWIGHIDNKCIHTVFVMYNANTLHTETAR